MVVKRRGEELLGKKFGKSITEDLWLECVAEPLVQISAPAQTFRTSHRRHAVKLRRAFTRNDAAPITRELIEFHLKMLNLFILITGLLRIDSTPLHWPGEPQIRRCPYASSAAGKA
jgi:hypothetical protein